MEDTLKDMFGAAMNINFIQGRADKFNAKFYCDVNTGEGVQKLIGDFQKNTYITVRKSKL